MHMSVLNIHETQKNQMFIPIEGYQEPIPFREDIVYLRQMTDPKAIRKLSPRRKFYLASNIFSGMLEKPLLYTSGEWQHPEVKGRDWDNHIDLFILTGHIAAGLERIGIRDFGVNTNIEIVIYYKLKDSGENEGFESWSNRNPKNGFPADATAMTIKIGRNLDFTMFHKFCYKIIATWDAFKNFNQNQVLISTFCLLRAENGSRSKWQFFTKEPLVQEAYSNLANAYSLLMTHCADSVTAEIQKTNRMVGLTPLSSLSNENSCIQRHIRLSDEDIDTIIEATVG